MAMITKRRLPIRIVLIALVAAASARIAGAASFRGRPRFVQQGRLGTGGARDIGYATSQDGGRTWIAGQLPGPTLAVGGVFQQAADPVVAIGPDGSVYAQSIAWDYDDLHRFSRSAISVQRSDDGGLTFGSPVLVQDDGPMVFNDKNWITVDTFPSSPHYGRVYSAWDRDEDVDVAGRQPQVLRYSDDRGETWSPLVAVSTVGPGWTIGAQPFVQPNGDLTVVYATGAPLATTYQFIAQTSHDGGDRFDAPVTIATPLERAAPGIESGYDLPAAAVDPVDGEIYVVWSDGRSPRPDFPADIVISVSTDGGASWGEPSVVNSSRGCRSFHCARFTPAVAAYAKDVHITFRTAKLRRGVATVFPACRRVSSALLANLIPPALPRPPTCTCAFTTTG